MNLEIYEKYRKVPSNALKAFNNGSFKGTDINTMWRIRCLTEEFGPCGIGWYFDIITLWKEDGADNEVMCFAEIKLYYKTNGEWSKGISATGGSKIIQYFSSKDYIKTNDEGYKMAITDAFGVACKHLGIGADVYWANDITKYSNNLDKPQTNAKTLPKKKEKNPQKEKLTPVTFVCDEMANDIYARASKKGFDEKAVNQVILATYKTDNIFELTTDEGNALIKRIEAAK